MKTKPTMTKQKYYDLIEQAYKDRASLLDPIRTRLEFFCSSILDVFAPTKEMQESLALTHINAIKYLLKKESSANTQQGINDTISMSFLNRIVEYNPRESSFQLSTGGLSSRKYENKYLGIRVDRSNFKNYLSAVLDWYCDIDKPIEDMTELKPTFYLRWVDGYYDLSRKNSVVKQSYEPFNTEHLDHMVLQQFWEDGKGGGEWRTIEYTNPNDSNDLLKSPVINESKD